MRRTRAFVKFVEVQPPTRKILAGFSDLPSGGRWKRSLVATYTAATYSSLSSRTGGMWSFKSASRSDLIEA